jgi:hypothetical protein
LGWGKLGLNEGGSDAVGWILLKAYLKLHDFDKYISRVKAALIFQNVRCKERMRKLCVLRDGILRSRLVNVSVYVNHYLCFHGHDSLFASMHLIR